MIEEFKMLTIEDSIKKLEEKLNELDLLLPFINDVDIVTIATEALEELKEYRKIGTVYECRTAVEKQKSKMPIKDALQYMRYTSSYVCPSCGRGFTGTGIANYCYHCGQRLDWSDEDV